MDLIFTPKLLLDCFCKIINNHSASSEKYFNKIIEPAFQNAKKVVDDYLNIFNEIKNRIKESQTREELIIYMEKARISCRTTREELRLTIESEKHNIWGVPRDLFVQGIWGILCGAIDTYEKEPLPHLETKYNSSNHTLLEVLYKIKDYGITPQTELKLLDTLKKQENALIVSFKDVSKGYMKLKAYYLNL